MGSKVEAEIVLSKSATSKAALEAAPADADVVFHDKEVLKTCKATPPSSSAFCSQHGHLLLRAPAVSQGVQQQPQDPLHRSLPLNDLSLPIALESAMFSGQLIITFRGTPSTPKQLFEGRRRRMWLALQGRFKRPVPLDALCFGTFLSQPLNLPSGSLLTRAAVWLVNKLGGGAQLDVGGATPYVKAPLIAAAQQVHVALPGQAPALMEAEEDMRLFDAALCSSWTGGPLAASKRQAWFKAPAKRSGRCYTTQHVYTFHIYDQAVDYSTFQLLLPLFPIDLVQVLGCQPLTVAVCDDESGDRALEVEIWHQRMLEHPCTAQAGQEEE